MYYQDYYTLQSALVLLSQIYTSLNCSIGKLLSLCSPFPLIQLHLQCSYYLEHYQQKEKYIVLRQLSLLYGILQSDNSIVKGILDRQSTVYSNDQESFCWKISEILDLYQLPPLEQLYNNLPAKEVWKTTVKNAVFKHWTTILRSDLQNKSTMSFCNIHQLSVGKVHHVWDSIGTSPLDVKKGIVKVRMLTGVYNLQEQKSKFSKAKISANCILMSLSRRNLNAHAHQLSCLP